MKRIFNVLLCLIAGFFVVSCAAQRTGDTRLEDIARYRTGMAYGLEIKDSYAYITTNSDLIIVDIANPKRPRRVGRLKLGRFHDGGEVRRVGIIGRYCITSDFENGLNILDVGNVSNPVKIGNLKYDRIRNFIATNNLVFLVDIGKGLRVVDISDKTNPVEATLVELIK